MARISEEKTAEDYRDKAEQYKYKLKEYNKTFLKTGAFVVTGIVALLFITVAWFANNTRVNSGWSDVGSDVVSFELLTEGQKSVYDKDIITRFFEGIFTGDDEKEFSTAKNDSISWRVSADSNIANFSEEDIDFTDENNDRADYAIEPGSNGKLVFYIVPGQSGTQTFELDLSLVPYRYEKNDYTGKESVYEVGAEGDLAVGKAARDIASGHILFFLAEDISDDSTYKWLDEGSFKITIEDAVAGEKYGYTIYWTWPQVFSVMILKSGDRYLNGREPMLNDVIRGQLIEAMRSNPERFFYNSLFRRPLSTEDSLIAEADGLMGIWEAEDADSYNPQNFVELSSFYNQGDQIIGNRISFVLLELSAVSAVSE